MPSILSSEEKQKHTFLSNAVQLRVGVGVF